MYIRRLKRVSAFFGAIFMLANIYSLSKAEKYDLLLEKGNDKQIANAFKQANDLHNFKFDNNENIFLRAIKYDRPLEIIDMIYRSGIKISDKNKQTRQDALIYAALYSTQEDVIRYIVSKYGKAKKVAKALRVGDAEGKSAYDYAKENENVPALVVFSPYLGITYEVPKQEAEPEETVEEEQSPEPEPEPTVEPETEEEDLPSSPTINYNKVYLWDYAPLDTDDEAENEDEDSFARIEEPDKRDRQGRTLLMLAAKAGNDWEIKSLLKSGANVNLTDKDGWTALMYAVRYQNSMDILNMLLDDGADPYIKNNFGATPLQFAATYSSNPEIVTKLVEKNAENTNEIFKSFILSITSSGGGKIGQIAKLKVFIEHGVPINRFYEGKTPLMYAAEYGTSTDIIKLLLENGAIVNIKTSDGKTAYNFAEYNTQLEHNTVYWSLNNR